VLRFDCLVYFPKSLRVPFSFRLGAHATTLAICLSLPALFGTAAALSAQVSTTTTLTVTDASGNPVTSVATGTVVVLTAKSIEAGSNNKVTKGTVNICDPNSLHCSGQHLFGSAQFTSKGTAVLKFKPAVGSHSYYAQFLGTTSDLASPSDIVRLTVAGGPYATTTAIAQSGSAGNYSLTATVSSSNSAALSPTGTIDFLDTTNSNYLLGDATLAVGPTTSTFAPFVTHYAGYFASNIVVADFNQDGIPDLLTTNNANTGATTNFFSILYGQAGGTFKGATSYTNNLGDVPSAIAVGDLNGDGYPDVVVAGLTTQLIYVYLNDGKGNLNGPSTYFFNYSGNLNSGPVWPVGGIAIGDVNRDGKQDVLITFPQFAIPGSSCSITGETGGCSAIGVMFGNGDGSLQMSDPNSTTEPWVPSYSSGFVGGGVNESEPIVLADLRGNGKLDTVGTYFNVGQICVGLGNGDGTFEDGKCYASPSGPSFAVGDFNGDGIPDLVVASSGGNGVSVLLGNGDGSFQSSVRVGPEAFTESVAAADVNGDGKVDVVAANDDGTINIMFGNGDGTFGATNSYHAAASGDRLDSLAVADLNGDGVMDVVVTDAGNWSANTLFGSLSTSATATLTGVSPVGSASTTHAVEATYGGDTYYSDSTSGTTALTPQPIPTTLALASNLSTVAVGGQVTLTATVSPDFAQNYTPTGTVTFYLNGNSVGTATPSNGVATLKPNLTGVQTDSFTATFAGDSNFVGSTSTAVSVVVHKAATTLNLGVCNYSTTWTCPATTSSYGQVMELTATLAPYSVTGGGSTDGETVTFYNNGTVIGTTALLYGGATLDIDQPAAGTYSFTASYAGDANFIASSTLSPSPMTVAKVTPSLSLGVSPVSTNTYGQPVYLTATFNTYPYNVSGETVTFYNGANVVGTATFGSQSYPAMLTLNNLPVGSYSFTAKFSGDANYLSTATTASALTVQKLPTTLTVSAPSSITFTYGSPITVQVFLGPYNVQGGSTTNGELVTLYQNGTSVGAAAVSGGIATFIVNAPPVGTNAYTASYAGDASFVGSTAAAAYVSVQKASTTMGITTDALHGISATGQPVTLTATVSSNLATGTAIFYQNGNDIGNGTLTNGVATLVVNGLPEGSYIFGASYGGDANFSGSTASPTASLKVLQATTLTLTTSPVHYAAPNQPVTITVTLSPYAPATDNTNGQMVYIFNGTSQFGNATLTNGVGTYTPNNGLPLGTYSFTAVYDSDNILANATTATPVAFSVVTGQLFVVNTSADDAGTAGYCTPQSSTTSNSTDSACSLRDALLAAAAAPEGASISFATSAFSAPTTITLTNGGLTLPANTTLTGPTLNSGGANVTNLVTVDGNGNYNQSSSTVFTVSGTKTAISNLTISGGWTPWNNGNPPSGGGIVNSGSLTLTNSTVTNNGTIASGGGIYNTGTLQVVGSAITGNTASANGPGNGGGIDNENNGTLTIINSTIANNATPNGEGSGMAVGSGTATITNSTISGNSGGLYNGFNNVAGTVKLANTIVSGNNGIEDIGGSYTDMGGNILGYVNGNPINGGNLNLSPLDNYGGPTQTMLPLPGSSAICTGSYLESPSQWNSPLVRINIDQRGYPNYNLVYGQLRYANGGVPLASACFDSGAVQTNYTAVQFQQTSYTGLAGGAVTPTVVASITENGVNRQAVPLTLSYSGSGNLGGNSATTVAGGDATFSSLSVDTAGNGALGTSVIIAGTSYINASTNLTVLGAPQITPGSESILTATLTPYSQSFGVSGGSGSYFLSTTGTVPAGLTLTPLGTATGAGWTLSGTPASSGQSSFTLTATDVTNSLVTVSQSYTITILPGSTTTLTASPASSAPVGQTITLTATVSTTSASGTVLFYDSGNFLGYGPAYLNGGSPNTATLALNTANIGYQLPFGAHSFTAQFQGDGSHAGSTSNAVPYNVTAPNLVVNTTSDDSGSFTCTTLASTTSNTTDGNDGSIPGECTLRDALNTASGLGAGSIYFDTAVFTASNLAANTIYPNIVANGSLTIPSNTTIQGLTSGIGVPVANLVTVDGGGTTVAGNGTIFLASGTSTAINNLNINNGYASNGGSGGAITNGSFNGSGSITISGSTFTGNQAAGSGGAIYNAFASTLTVVNSTFSSNSTTGGNGGAIDNANYYGCGTTRVSNSTFYQNTAANGGSGYGGAINNDGNGPCQVTVNSSTIVGNSTDNSNPSDGYGGGGGGIYSQYLLYLANNVITGNTISGAGEDDVDDNFWGSNYWGGNNVTLGNNIINGNLIGLWNGETENGTNVSLAPLANYGGPTPTMIPVPGSAAICAGVANGPGTDQRGFPNSNANYPGFNSGTSCVDAGAVQTNYALAFTTQPPASATTGIAIAPAPVVALTESGVPAAFATSSVTMTDSAGVLGGSTSANLTAGSAVFSNLVFSSAVSNDTLSANLSLNPALSAPLGLSVPASSALTVGGANQPPALYSPAVGTALGTSNVTFAWTPGVGIAKYDLLIGNSGPGSSNIFNSGITSATSATVASLPVTGGTIYVRLMWIIGSGFHSADYTFTEGRTAATLLSPSAGASLGTSNVAFTWSPGVGVTSYDLLVGNTGPGSSDIYNSGLTTSTSATIANLPVYAGTIYVRLMSIIGGAFQSVDYTYTEGNTAATLVSPSAGTSLATSNVTFSWTAGVGTTQYDLLVGNSGPGSSDIYNSGITTSTSATIANLPVYAGTIYVRLMSIIGGTFRSVDYTFTEGNTAATLVSPSAGTSLATSNVTFSWTAGVGTTHYDLLVGNTGPGSSDIFNSGITTATSATIAKLPVYGGTIYVRLMSIIGGAFRSVDYTFTEGNTPATLIFPSTGTSLGTSNVGFTWNPGAGTTRYDLLVGTSGPGSANLYNSGITTSTSATIPNLPVYGGTIYVRLMSIIGGAFQSVDYTFTE
jgi:hypothetical protein